MSRVTILTICAGLVVAAPWSGQAQTTAAAPAQDQAQLLKMEQEWGPASSTPGMTLSLLESDRIPANSYQTGTAKDQRFGPTIVYNLRAEGVPKDKNFTLVSWPVTAKGPAMTGHGVTLDPHGTATCAGSLRGGCKGDDNGKSPVQLKERPLPGEPVRFGLVSSDGAVKLYTQVVPFPIDGKSHGCRVEAVVLAHNAATVMVHGTGFAPGASVELSSKNGKDESKATLQADAKGEVAQIETPQVQGETRGTMKVTLKAEKCSPSMSVPWGEP